MKHYRMTWLAALLTACLLLASAALAEEISAMNVDEAFEEVEFALTGSSEQEDEETYEVISNEQKDISDETIVVSRIEGQGYTGEALTPALTIKDYGNIVTGPVTLKEDTDYTLEYKDNIEIGTATATITGIGKYTGTRTATSKIVAADKTKRTLKIKLKDGVKITKVYDKTRNVTLAAKDIAFDGLADGDAVVIKAISAAYDKADAGQRIVTASVELNDAQTQSTLYTYELEKSTVTFDAEITRKALTVTPTAGQSKAYGNADPSYYKGSVSGLYKGDSVTGAIGRESGEAVGTYKYTAGTLSAGENYEVVVKDGEFTIVAKSMTDKTITAEAIANQTYTGSEIRPDVTLKNNGAVMSQGIDYTLSYSNNKAVGLATVTITGKGNYTGTRNATFRIVNTSHHYVPTETDPEDTTDPSSPSFTDFAPPVSIKIDKTSDTIKVGRSRFLKVRMAAEDPDCGVDTKLTWKSSKPGVLAVDKATGKITAKKAGVAKITVKTSNKLSDSVTLTVVDPAIPTGVEIADPGIEYLGVGDKVQLTPKLEIEKADAKTRLTWRSSKAAVAKVDKNGVVTGRKAGVAVITVTTANKLKASIAITVKDIHAPTAVSITSEAGNRVAVKGTLQLKAELKAIDEPRTKLQWKSSKAAVAKVDKNGVVTGKKPGTATITVTTGNKLKATFDVIVE